MKRTWIKVLILAYKDWKEYERIICKFRNIKNSPLDK